MKAVTVKTTCGLRFKLLKNKMQEIQAEALLYSATRANIARMFRVHASQMPYMMGKSVYLCHTYQRSGTVRIGCCGFDRANTRLLKKWAKV